MCVLRSQRRHGARHEHDAVRGAHGQLSAGALRMRGRALRLHLSSPGRLSPQPPRAAAQLRVQRQHAL